MIDTIEIKWGLLGAKLANLSDKEQAEFFAGFSFELSKYESQYKRELQLLSVRDRLSNANRKMLEESLPCLWFNDN